MTKRAESDVPIDRGTAASRATGGVPNESAAEPNSTTGTTPNETFVGRVAGDDSGYAGLTGAEARAEAERATPDTSARELIPEALEAVSELVRDVPDDRWSSPTPCEHWAVRDVVNHLASEHLWARDLLSGETIEQVGERYDGDVLGDNPVLAWERAALGSREAWSRLITDDVPIRLSFGETTVGEYAEQMLLDLVVHGWDLARGAGLPERADPRLARHALRYAEAHADMLAGSSMFAPPVPVNTADPQTRLIALLGRHP